MAQSSGQGYNLGEPVTLDAVFFQGSMPEDPSAVTFRVRQPDDTLVQYVFGVDANVTRLGTGEYECALSAPPFPGQYHYDAVATGDVETVLPGSFYVNTSNVVTPAVVPGEPPQAGPCTSWIQGEDVAFLCGVEPDENNSNLLDTAAVSASQVLFEMSGRQYAGTCSQTVRPCMQPCGAWSTLAGYPSQWWGFGFNGIDWGGGGWGWWGQNGRALCGCQPLSQVKLPGYPAVEITSVTIDGVNLPETDADGDLNWRLDDNQLLTRMDKPGSPSQPRWWPGCQNLALAETENGTFAVTYVFGTPPPLPGWLAAQELGCEIYKSLSGQDCALPAGATQVNRQGVNITRGLLVSWALAQGTRGGPHPRSWSTGLPLVDMFLSSYNPWGRRSRARIFSPDIEQFARKVG